MLTEENTDFGCDFVVDGVWGRREGCGRRASEHIGNISLCWQHYSKLEKSLGSAALDGDGDAHRPHPWIRTILEMDAERERWHLEEQRKALKAAQIYTDVRLSRIAAGVLA